MCICVLIGIRGEPPNFKNYDKYRWTADSRNVGLSWPKNVSQSYAN